MVNHVSKANQRLRIDSFENGGKAKKIGLKVKLILLLGSCFPFRLLKLTAEFIKPLDVKIQ